MSRFNARSSSAGSKRVAAKNVEGSRTPVVRDRNGPVIVE